MKKTFFLACMLIMLNGCAAHDAQINPMLNGMADVNQAVHAFGPPDQASDMYDGSKVYVWSTSRSVQFGGFPVYQPNNQAHTGNVYPLAGGYVGSYSGQSYGSGTVRYTPVQELNYSCTLKMIVEPSGRITTWSYQGNSCDSLIVNESLPPSLPGKSQDIHGCLEQSARNYVGQGLEFESVSAKIEQECEQKTGGRIPNLAKYYARQAENK